MGTKDLEHNVVCVKWGDKFTAEHVNRLYRMAERNITLPFNFYCYTEDSEGVDERINIVSLDTRLDLKAWWWKLTMFKQNDYDGVNLYLDLDVVIQNNIDHLFDEASHNKLTLIDQVFEESLNDYSNDYFQEFSKHTKPYYNSSIMVWYNNENQDLYNKFVKSIKLYTNLYHGIDRFFSYEIPSANFCSLSEDDWYFRCKLTPHMDPDKSYFIRLDTESTLAAGGAVIGKVLVFYDESKAICVFNSCHESIFYSGMGKYLL